MYAVCVTLRIHPGHMAAFLPLVVANAKTSRTQEQGCQTFDVCVQDDVVFLYEIYADRAAFDLHLTTPHFKTFDNNTAGMIASKQVGLFEQVIQ